MYKKFEKVKSLYKISGKKMSERTIEEIRQGLKKLKRRKHRILTP